MVNLVWVATWAILGFLVGVLGYLLAGFGVNAVPRRVGDHHARVNAAANHYAKQALKILGHGILVERGTSFDLYRGSHDPEKGADGFTLDGQQAHVTNDSGLLSTLFKRPFGLVPPPEDDVATYVSPELGELGKLEAEWAEHGPPEDGATATLPPRRPLVQLREYAERMVPGSLSLYDLAETEELYKQSQRLFGESKTTQFMILIIAYCAPFIVVWILLTQAGGAVPEDAVNIGLGGVITGWWL